MSGRSWIKAGLLVLGCLGANLAQAALYVYELPDGSRVVTDHALNGRNYRLIRVGETARNIGKLAAHQDPQLFRADPSTYDRLIRRVANQYDVDFALVKAVMHVESGFNPYAKSNKGALGLMQLLPTTAQRYGIDDVYDPVSNVIAGVRHLKYLLTMFNDKQKLALAAYNAGENAVYRYRGIPPYPETQAYVRKVLQYCKQYSRMS
jgi:soluble lytic murein transglycosylase-like protein